MCDVFSDLISCTLCMVCRYDLHVHVYALNFVTCLPVEVEHNSGNKAWKKLRKKI